MEGVIGILALFVEKREKEKSGGEGIGSGIQRCVVEMRWGGGERSDCYVSPVYYLYFTGV